MTFWNALTIVIPVLSFKGTTQAYLQKISIAHTQRNLNPLLDLLIDCISAKSAPQMLLYIHTHTQIKLIKIKNIYLFCFSYLNFLFIISFVSISFHLSIIHTLHHYFVYLPPFTHTQHYIISPRQNINFILVKTG